VVVARSACTRVEAGALNEVVPFVDARYRTLTSAAHRGIAGKSCGGFGAMITPMLRPNLFGGLAGHAADALYELSYIPGFGKVVGALRAYDGSYERFWEDFASRPPMSKDTDAPGRRARMSSRLSHKPPWDPVRRSVMGRPMLRVPESRRQMGRGPLQSCESRYVSHYSGS
jgi:hypothetical protein